MKSVDKKKLKSNKSNPLSNQIMIAPYRKGPLSPNKSAKNARFINTYQSQNSVHTKFSQDSNLH